MAAEYRDQVQQIAGSSKQGRKIQGSGRKIQGSRKQGRKIQGSRQKHTGANVARAATYKDQSRDRSHTTLAAVFILLFASVPEKCAEIKRGIMLSSIVYVSNRFHCIVYVVFMLLGRL